MAIDANDSVYVVGRSDGSTTQYGSIAVKYTTAGSEQWRISSPGNVAMGIAVDGAGHVITGGTDNYAQGVPTISVKKYSQLPLSPVITRAIPASGHVIIAFASPAIGGSSITGYMATCDPGNATAYGRSSPITVVGLTNGTTVGCSVMATNAFGNGMPSNIVNVTPSSMPVLALVKAESRKTHGPAGMRAISITPETSLGGMVNVEPRAAGNSHQIAFTFNDTISSVAAASTRDLVGGTVNRAFTITGNEVIVTLEHVVDRSLLEIALANVNQSGENFMVAVGFLQGDITRSRFVSAADISMTKANLGKLPDNNNFLMDVDASGVIDSSDLSAIKARSGNKLP
jgi:hypothetical protein